MTNKPYGRLFSVFISYLFSLTCAYFIYGAVSKSTPAPGFLLQNIMQYDTLADKYALLACFAVTSIAAFFLYSRGYFLFMHAVSATLASILAWQVFDNSWFEYQNIFMTLIITAGLSFYILKLAPVLPQLKTGGKIYKYAFYAFLAVYVSYFIWLCLTRHAALLSNCFDLGWENQAMYNLSQTGIPFTTMGTSPNNFGDHTAFIYYLFAPFYRLFPRPEFLLVLQVFFIGAAGLFAYLTADKSFRSAPAAAVVSAAFLLHPGVQNMMLSDFHPITAALPLFMACFYAAESGKTKLFALSYFLIFFVREDAAFGAMFLPLYFLSIKKLSLKNAILLLGAGAILLTTDTLVLKALGKTNEDLLRFSYFTPDSAGVISLIFINPVYTLMNILQKAKIEFLIITFAPFLFLSFAALENMILLAPGLIFTVLSSHTPHFTSGFQHGTLLVAAMFYTFIHAARKHDDNLPRRNAALGFILIFSLMWSFLYRQLLFQNHTSSPG